MIELQKNISNMYCANHKIDTLKFAEVSLQTKSPFYCCICLSRKSRNQTQQVISIQDVLEQEESKPIQNWPPGIEQETLDLLQEISEINIKNDIKNKIDQEYKELQSFILYSIEQSKNEQMNILEKVHLKSEDIIKFYNNAFKRKELQNIFSKNNLEEIEENYIKLLKNISENNYNINQFKMLIKPYQFVTESLKQNKVELVKQNIKELIQKINFFTYNDFNFLYSFNNLKIEYNEENQLQNNAILNSIFKQLNQQKYDLVQFVSKINDENNNIVIQKEDSLVTIESNNLVDNQRSFIFIQQLLSKKCTQIFRFKFNMPFYQLNKSCFGIQSFQKVKDAIFEKDYICFLYNSSECNLKVIKGENLSNASNKDRIMEIELKVSISNNLFEISDFPNKQNILRFNSQFNDENEYRLYFRLNGTLKKKLIFTHYDELNN